MEIRLIGTEAEIEAAVVIIRQQFIVHNDGGNYQGRNPRYTDVNQSNRIRKLVVSAKPVTPRTGREGASYTLPHSQQQPRANDAVKGGD